MKLFDEMEKCFPEMEKHFWEVYEPDGLIGFWDNRHNRENFFFWTFTHFFVNESPLMEQFYQAGVESRTAMTNDLIRWFLYDLCSRDELIREDIAPALESTYQWSRQVL